MALWLEVDDAGGLLRASDGAAALLDALDPRVPDLKRLLERRVDVRAAIGRRAGAVRFGLGRGASRLTFDAVVTAGASGVAHLRLEPVEPLQGDQDLGRLLLAHTARNPDAWTVTDPDGILLWCDESYAWLVGREAAAIVGRPAGLVRSPKIGKREIEGYWRSLYATGSWAGPTLVQRSDGVDVPVHQSVSAVQDAHGRTTHYVSIFQDISRETELERLGAIDLAVGLLSRIGGDQAHQLNNLAAEIVATCDRAMLSDDPASAGTALERVLAIGVKLGELGRQMAAMTTTEAGVGPADLGRVARDLSELLSRAGGVDGPPIQVDVPKEGVWVACPPDGLVRACIHLALRSLEGVQLGSTVEVTAVEDYDEGLLRIRYVPTPSERAALRFLMPEGQVTGPMVNELAARAYGAGVRLGLEEERDGRVSVCVRAKLAEVVPVGRVFRSSGAATRERVLVADDNGPLRELMGVTLESLFTEVELVADGNAAMAQLNAWGGRVDLVVLDLRMPGMDGLEVLRQALKTWPQLRFILIAGAATEGQMRQALDLGARAVLPKPFRLHELRAMVRSVLEDAQW